MLWCKFASVFVVIRVVIRRQVGSHSYPRFLVLRSDLLPLGTRSLSNPFDSLTSFPAVFRSAPHYAVHFPDSYVPLCARPSADGPGWCTGAGGEAGGVRIVVDAGPVDNGTDASVRP